MGDYLVPTLWEAFALENKCDINLDPLTAAVYCFALEKGLTAAEALENGSVLFPQRSVKLQKTEAARLKRFQESYPKIFTYDTELEELTLIPRALETIPHENDEYLYRILLNRLYRLCPQQVTIAISALDV